MIRRPGLETRALRKATNMYKQWSMVEAMIHEPAALLLLPTPGIYCTILLQLVGRRLTTIEETCYLVEFTLMACISCLWNEH